MECCSACTCPRLRIHHAGVQDHKLFTRATRSTEALQGSFSPTNTSFRAHCLSTLPVFVGSDLRTHEQRTRGDYRQVLTDRSGNTPFGWAGGPDQQSAWTSDERGLQPLTSTGLQPLAPLAAPMWGSRVLTLWCGALGGCETASATRSPRWRAGPGACRGREPSRHKGVPFGRRGWGVRGVRDEGDRRGGARRDWTRDMTLWRVMGGRE